MQLENAAPLIWRLLLYILGIFESVVRRLLSYNAKIAHKPHSVIRVNLVQLTTPSQLYWGAKTHWTSSPPSRNMTQ